VARAPAEPGGLQGVVRDNAPFAASVVAYLAIGIPVLASLDRSVPIPLLNAYRIPVLVTILYLFGTLLATIARVVFIGRRPPFTAATWRAVGRAWLPPDRLAGTLIVLLLLPPFLAVMLGFRTAITSFQPFHWDIRLMHLDAWLHGGQQPWELLQPVLGHPAVTRFLDAFYVYGWFAMLWIGLAWQTVHGREPIRSQFLLAFLLAWVVLGTVSAIVFSSAGPVYFSSVTSMSDPYAPLLSYLASVDAETPLRALAVQKRLWAEYTSWGGITAMPSMHLAQTTVVLLAAVRSDRRLGWLMAPALGLILLGSIHLGWHYAVDSYAGILGAGLMWVLAGRIVVWWRNRTNPTARTS
jgi:hypothetical protein